MVYIQHQKENQASITVINPSEDLAEEIQAEEEKAALPEEPESKSTVIVTEPTPVKQEEKPVVKAEESPITTSKETVPVAEKVVTPATNPATTPAPAVAAPAATGGGIIIEYELRKGDLVSRLAKNFNFPTKEILELNQLENADKIQLGQKLKLKVKAQHKVGKGDTWDGLAKKFSLETERLQKVNPRPEGKKDLQEGEILNIPF